MTKLNQALAIEQSVQKEAHSVLTKAHHALQTTGVDGVARTYTPEDDEGERLPNEGKLVQVRAPEEIDKVTEALTTLFNATAQKDWANTQARADVSVNGTILLRDAPVPYLLWVEKKLVDLRTFIDKLPTLDPGVEWEEDPASDSYRSQPIQTRRTAKEPKVIVKYDATDKHPAQTELLMIDKPVGTWSTIKYSGALPKATVQRYRENVIDLQRAVKKAREEANLTEVEDIDAGEPVLSFIFG